MGFESLTSERRKMSCLVLSIQFNLDMVRVSGPEELRERQLAEAIEKFQLEGLPVKFGAWCGGGEKLRGGN